MWLRQQLKGTAWFSAVSSQSAWSQKALPGSQPLSRQSDRRQLPFQCFGSLLSLSSPKTYEAAHYRLALGGCRLSRGRSTAPPRHRPPRPSRTSNHREGRGRERRSASGARGRTDVLSFGCQHLVRHRDPSSPTPSRSSTRAAHHRLRLHIPASWSAPSFGSWPSQPLWWPRGRLDCTVPLGSTARLPPPLPRPL